MRALPWHLDLQKSTDGVRSYISLGLVPVECADAARLALPDTTPSTFAWDETFDVGMDTGTSVDDKDYQVPFDFTGKIEKITVDLGEGPVSEASMVKWMKDISSRDAEQPAPGIAPSK